MKNAFCFICRSLNPIPQCFSPFRSFYLSLCVCACLFGCVAEPYSQLCILYDLSRFHHGTFVCMQFVLCPLCRYHCMALLFLLSVSMFPFYTRNIVTFEPFAFDAFEMLRQRIGFKRTQTNNQTLTYTQGEKGRGRERETRNAIVLLCIYHNWAWCWCLYHCAQPFAVYKTESNKGRGKQKIGATPVPCACVWYNAYTYKKPTFFMLFALCSALEYVAFFYMLACCCHFILELNVCTYEGKRENAYATQNKTRERETQRVHLPLQMCVCSVWFWLAFTNLIRRVVFL